MAQVDGDEAVAAAERTAAVTPSTEQGLEKEGSTLAATNVSDDEGPGHFSSRWAFWASAIGCSVGYGNMWRFPFLVFDQGGLAFFIPYIIALVIIGLPVSILEFGLGQMAQGGQARAFRSLHRRMGSLGWAPLMLVNIIYYPILQTWSILFFGYSFKRQLPWLVSEDDRIFCEGFQTQPGCMAEEICQWSLDEAGTGVCVAFALNKAKWFFERELHAKPEYWEGVSHFSWIVLLIELVTWVLICLVTIGGAKILGYVNYVLMVVPAVLLIVQVGVSCSLPGANVGVRQYMGEFDGAKLKTASIWTVAAGQTLFSLGATQGTMVGYSAHNRKSQNFVQDTYIVALGDTVFAIVAGFAIFAVTGYLSLDSGVPFNELELSGRGLAFQTYPVGLGQGIPYPGGNIMCALFFLTLYMLGFSTNVGLVEAAALILHESRFWQSRPHLKKWHSYVIICGIIFMFSFIDATDMALHVLDCADEFVATFSFLFLGGAEAIAAGWFAAWDLWHSYSGSTAIYVHMATFVLGCCLGPVLGFALSATYGHIIGPVVGALFIGGGLGVAWGISKDVHPSTGKRLSAWDRLYYLTMYNIMQLRQFFNETACKGTCPCSSEGGSCCCSCRGPSCDEKLSCWRVPRVWCVAIKYLVPLCSSILFFEAVTNPYFTYKLPTSPGDGMPTYPWWVFLLGNLGPYALVVGIIVFFFAPSWMNWLLPEEMSEFEWPDNPTAGGVKVAASKEGLEMMSATPSVLESPENFVPADAATGGAE